MSEAYNGMKKMQNADLIWLRISALVSVFAILPACTEDTPDAGMMVPATHRNSLRIVAPARYAITETADGFRLTLTTAVRPVHETIIEVHDAPPTATGIVRTKRTDAGTVAYTVQALNGGSGGTAYALTAWRPMGEGWIVVTAVRQQEWGEPHFVEAWNILETASLSKSK